MADKPIPFSTPMVIAIDSGIKTQTRRTLRPQPSNPIRVSPFVESGLEDIHGMALRPQYFCRDRLWVREAWRVSRAQDALPGSKLPRPITIEYIADGKRYFEGRYRHARFMPRWASRITLTVTEVRVQRLQDISEEDAIAEGITQETVITDIKCYGGPPVEETAMRYFNNVTDDDEGYESAIDAYAALWDRINGPGAWNTNPWVGAYTFTFEKQNIDHKLEVSHGR